MIDARVFVGLEGRQLFLAHVDHRGSFAKMRVFAVEGEERRMEDEETVVWNAVRHCWPFLQSRK